MVRQRRRHRQSLLRPALPRSRPRDRAEGVVPPAPGQPDAPRLPIRSGTPSGAWSGGPAMPEAERRQLTVLVCRLVGLPERAAPLDPEVLLEVVPDFHTLCAEVVHRYAGHLAQDQGDSLVVYFGYPQAHEDDARRAVYAGLGMVEAMRRFNARRVHDQGVRLAVRVGIHTGLVVMRALGRGDSREPLALGEYADHCRPGARPGAPRHGGHQPGHPAPGRGVCRRAGVGDVSPGRCHRAPGGLPGPPGASRPEPVCRHGHERPHPVGGPGAGGRAAARALGAGQGRPGAGGRAQRRGRDRQIAAGAGAHGAPGGGRAYAHRVPLFALLPSRVPCIP